MTQKFTRADDTIDTFGAMEHAQTLQRQEINISLRRAIKLLIAPIGRKASTAAPQAGRA